MPAHPHTMVQFSAWANNRIYDARKSMPAGEVERDRGAFFRSIHGTLNHIVLVDLLYRERIEQVRTRFRTLDEVVHESLGALQAE
jgi:uncharacterized damage-inducible protein DinB